MSKSASGIEQRLQQLRSRIVAAAGIAGRDPAQIRLIAASKTFDAVAVRAAHAAGQVDFGENYVQEALDKMVKVQAMLAADIESAASHHPAGVASPQAGPLLRPLVWHFIGPIQSNKTRAIAEHFDWVHSVDRLKIAERLSAQRPASLPPLDICLEVNISGEASKGGVSAEDLPTLAQAVSHLPRLRLRGLMAIPAPSSDPLEQRAAFAAVRRLYEALRASGYSLDTLSMGMSGDLEAAIAEGATMVRVGTAIFGERVYA
jgi:PLP dependent protein